MKKAIIIGATSGIGRALAKVLSERGYLVGVTGRRVHLLQELHSKLPNRSFFQQMDVTDTASSMKQFKALANEMDGVDLVVISAGTGFLNPELSWPEEKTTIDVNITGFAAIANAAVEHFTQRDSGHLVGISSIAAIRGSGDAPSYNASKAFMSNYLEGLRINMSKKKLPVIVTDVRPGFVDTAMAKGENLFWVASPEKAAIQIHAAIEKRKTHVYVTKRWRVIAWVLKVLPGFIYKNIQ